MDDLFAFSVDRVSTLTGLSIRQLRYWDKTKVYEPEFTNGSRRQAYSRIYSFRDVVGLRALAQLRERVPLQELRRVGAWLKERYTYPWSSLRFGILGRSIVFGEPSTDEIISTRPAGQRVLTMFDLERVVADVRTAIRQLNQRGPDEIGKVIRDRHVMGNAPVLAGTRIPTSIIWDFYAAGSPPNTIRAMYPHLTIQDIDAAISFEQESRAKQAG